MVNVCCNLAVHSDRMLARLFEYAARGLPLITQPSAPAGAELHAPIRSTVGTRAGSHTRLGIERLRPRHGC